MDVLILCGSASDLEVLGGTTRTLGELGVTYELHVASAHRTPDRVRELVAAAEREGARVVVAGAGLAAHLAGAVAALTCLPVVGVPLAAGPLNGLDALLSTAQMPPGIPVATVAIGGAVNAAVLAAQIVAAGREDVRGALREWRARRARAVTESDPAARG